VRTEALRPFAGRYKNTSAIFHRRALGLFMGQTMFKLKVKTKGGREMTISTSPVALLIQFILWIFG